MKSCGGLLYYVINHHILNMVKCRIYGKENLMKKINQLLIFVTLGFAAFLCLINIYLSQKNFQTEEREYRISINRIEKAIRAFEEENACAPKDLPELMKFAGVEEYPSITNLYVLLMEEGSKEEMSHFFTEEDEDYVLLATNDYYYRVTYVAEGSRKGQIYILVNGIAVLFFTIMLVFLFYIRQKILLPFYKLSELPYELSKGNMTVPLQENKDKFFGKFVWGMDLLRENLEENKMRELELQKEKKLLLLSLSHDIKTPLSAIKLYAKALSRNLYKEEAKKQEIADNINEKVDEIEGYISEIVTASNEDFLQFDVNNGEIYMKDVLEQIREYYTDKMSLNQIAFEIGTYPNCLVFGDGNRLVEVLQNVIENAIKYGDGRKIWLTINREDEEYNIRIFNTGCQLETKELPHLFDSFFRGSNVGKKPGSGLGLYICRQLMHLMEGEITAHVVSQEKETVMMVQVTVHLV